MRIVVYEDKDGWMHRALLRDSDPDTAAPGGMMQDPPDLRGMDWEGVMRDIHNRLVELNITTWADWQAQQHALHNITFPLKRRLIQLLRAQEA